MSVEDRLAIIDLTIAYCWALDAHDWAALENVFLPDATAELASPLLQGVEAIKTRVATALDPLDESQHMVTNHQVTIEGDRATCRCYLQAQHVRRAAGDGGAGVNFIVAGRYEDEMVRAPQGWRIKHRRLVRMWEEGNPGVLRPQRST